MPEEPADALEAQPRAKEEVSDEPKKKASDEPKKKTPDEPATKEEGEAATATRRPGEDPTVTVSDAPGACAQPSGLAAGSSGSATAPQYKTASSIASSGVSGVVECVVRDVSACVRDPNGGCVAMMAQVSSGLEGDDSLELIVDSGASVAALPERAARPLRVDSRLPEHVRQTYKTASGEVLHVSGVVRVPVLLSDWAPADMDFAVMPVTRPLIGVSRLVARGNKVVFGPRARIWNIQTGEDGPSRKGAGCTCCACGRTRVVSPASTSTARRSGGAKRGHGAG